MQKKETKITYINRINKEKATLKKTLDKQIILNNKLLDKLQAICKHNEFEQIGNASRCAYCLKPS